MNYLLISRRLRAARLAAGFEDEAMYARELNLTAKFYRDVETGKHKPSLELLAMISELTGKSLDFLVKGSAARR